MSVLPDDNSIFSYQSILINHSIPVNIFILFYRYCCLILSDVTNAYSFQYILCFTPISVIALYRMQQLLAHRNILVLFADALIVLYRRWNHLLIFNVHLLFCRYYHLILSGAPSQCNVSLSFTNIIILFLSVIIATTGALQRLVLLLPISSFSFIGCSHYLCSLQHMGSFC